MAELDKVKTISAADGGQVRIVSRGRYVHLEVTDGTGQTTLIRLLDNEARSLVPAIKIEATKAEKCHRRIKPEDFIRVSSGETSGFL